MSANFVTEFYGQMETSVAHRAAKAKAKSKAAKAVSSQLPFGIFMCPVDTLRQCVAEFRVRFSFCCSCAGHIIGPISSWLTRRLNGL